MFPVPLSAIYNMSNVHGGKYSAKTWEQFQNIPRYYQRGVDRKLYFEKLILLHKG